MNYAATENSHRCAEPGDQVLLLLHAKLYRSVAKIQQNHKKSPLKTIYIVKIRRTTLNRSGWIWTVRVAS